MTNFIDRVIALRLLAVPGDLKFQLLLHRSLPCHLLDIQLLAIITTPLSMVWPQWMRRAVQGDHDRVTLRGHGVEAVRVMNIRSCQNHSCRAHGHTRQSHLSTVQEEPTRIGATAMSRINMGTGGLEPRSQESTEQKGGRRTTIISTSRYCQLQACYAYPIDEN